MTMGPQAAGEPLDHGLDRAGPLVGPVLRRVVGDARRPRRPPARPSRRRRAVADLIAARAPAHVTGRPSKWRSSRARARCRSRRPVAAGGGKALIVDAAVPGVGNVIEQLADELRVASEDGSEHLLVRLAYADDRD